MCGASSCINGELSEWISDILDAMGDADGSEEAISGEEMQSYVDDLAHELLEIGSPEMGICI